MVKINLLPPELRKKEKTPLPRFLLIVIGAGLVTTFAFYVAWHHFIKLNDLKKAKANIEESIAKLTIQVKEYEDLSAKIANWEGKKDSIEKTLQNRPEWTYIIELLTDIIPYDDRNYLAWFEDLNVIPGSATEAGIMSFAIYIDIPDGKIQWLEEFINKRLTSTERAKDEKPKFWEHVIGCDSYQLNETEMRHNKEVRKLKLSNVKIRPKTKWPKPLFEDKAKVSMAGGN